MTRFMILSDIHASEEDPSSPSAPSYVSSYNARASGHLDPIDELEKLIERDELVPDYILCAGDMTNRSNVNSFNYIWKKLHNLSNKTNAPLICTVGNHDIDSRYQANKNDPRGYAMSLQPRLPIEQRIPYLEYWALHFTLLTYDTCNILVLNTAAYHGFSEDAEIEVEHGRISDITIENIKVTLSTVEKRPTNILLCHHHPIRAERGDQNLIGLTRGGEKLVEILNDAPHPWIVIHGHKHIPDLYYGHGGAANTPVIMGSASFSAQVNTDAQNKNPNQVHLLETDPEGARRDGLAYAGTVISWSW